MTGLQAHASQKGASLIQPPCQHLSLLPTIYPTKRGVQQKASQPQNFPVLLFFLPSSEAKKQLQSLSQDPWTMFTRLSKSYPSIKPATICARQMRVPSFEVPMFEEARDGEGRWGCRPCLLIHKLKLAKKRGNLGKLDEHGHSPSFSLAMTLGGPISCLENKSYYVPLLPPTTMESVNHGMRTHCWPLSRLDILSSSPQFSAIVNFQEDIHAGGHESRLRNGLLYRGLGFKSRP